MLTLIQKHTHSYFRLAVVFVLVTVCFAKENHLIIQEGKSRVKVGRGAGETLSLLDFTHLVQASSLEDSSYQAACVVSEERLADLEATPGKDVT